MAKKKDKDIILEEEAVKADAPESGIKLVLDEEPTIDVDAITENLPEHKIELVLDDGTKAEEKPADPIELVLDDGKAAEPEEPAAEEAAEPVIEPESFIEPEPEDTVYAEPAIDPERWEEAVPEEPVDLGFLGGGLEELKAVREAINNLSDTEQAFKETEKSLKAKKKELDVQKKRVEEKISSTIKKARSELEKGFDEEINAAEKAIKEAETKKKNAKAAAVNERMKRENSSLVDENKVLTAEVKNSFKEAKVPALCRSRLYYALFEPKKNTDYIICIAAILIFAVVIPLIVTSFIHSGLLKVLVWIIIVVCFAALYFLIAAWTKKGEKNETITRMRSNVDQIAANKKFIKDRNRNIKADPDESQYNLYEYDQQVEAARMDYETARSEKEQAMMKFENEDSVNIRSEMEEEKRPIFEELEREIEQMSEDLQIRSDAYQEAAKVMDGYNSEFGDKGIKADKVDDLISIISEGRASTIREALDVQKSK